jgi:hypothetical protein
MQKTWGECGVHDDWDTRPRITADLLLAVTLPTATLSGRSSAPPPSTAAPPTTSTSARVTTTTTTTPAAKTGSEPAASGICQDATGDGRSSDLTTVTRSRAGTDLRVVWTVKSWSKQSAGFFLNVASADGSAAGQLGVKYEAGQQIGYFMFDSTRNINLPGHTRRPAGVRPCWPR